MVVYLFIVPSETFCRYNHDSRLQGVDSAKDLSDDNLKANGLFPGAGQTNFVSNGSNNSNSANGGSVNSQVGWGKIRGAPRGSESTCPSTNGGSNVLNHIGDSSHFS